MEKIDNRISIWGSCVTRDIFGTHIDNGGYKISCFIQSNHPISAVSPCLSPDHKMDFQKDDRFNLFAGESNFQRKMADIDWNKTTFSYLRKFKSDYIILDASSLRFDLISLSYGDRDDAIYITNTDKNKIFSMLKAYNI